MTMQPPRFVLALIAVSVFLSSSTAFSPAYIAQYSNKVLLSRQDLLSSLSRKSTLPVPSLCCRKQRHNICLTATQPNAKDVVQSVVGAPQKTSALTSEVNYLEAILTTKVYDIAVETPLSLMPRLSDRMGGKILLKREDMQPVFSFKLRGAYNMIAHLSDAERAKGVITASAGNHAQGVAMSARHLECRAVIVMPTVTPSIKVNSVRQLGAEVVLIGDNFDEASAYAKKRAIDDKMVYIPPFDHPLVIAGQGTIGMEILRQCSNPIDAIFIPVGGGGLIAGVAAFVKRLRPDTKIIGVEPTGADALYRSLQAGQRVTLDKVDTFADGVAVKVVGEETFRLCRDMVDEVILVDTDETCVAMKDIFEDTRSIMEPSGALGVAAAKKYLARDGCAGKTVVAIASGANMNFDKLRTVAERAGTSEKEEAMLASVIPETRGSFRRFVQILSEVGLKRGTGPRSITEFKYRCSDKWQKSGKAQVLYSVETENRQDTLQLVQQLRAAGLETIDLSKNEIVKEHVRYLSGGAASLEDERLFRIEFPERAGALRKFLDVVGEEYNISLFHYRGAGGLVGRVFVGIAPLPASRLEAFNAAIRELGWMCVDETGNQGATFI